MTQEEILEGNKIIVHSPFSHENIKNTIDEDIMNYGEKHYLELKYHYSFDWLMPVALKISKEFCKDYELIIYPSSVYIKSIDNKNISFMGTGLCIEALYNCIIDFIKWYNQQIK